MAICPSLAAILILASLVESVPVPQVFDHFPGGNVSVSSSKAPTPASLETPPGNGTSENSTLASTVSEIMTSIRSSVAISTELGNSSLVNETTSSGLVTGSTTILSGSVAVENGTTSSSSTGSVGSTTIQTELGNSTATETSSSISSVSVESTTSAVNGSVSPIENNATTGAAVNGTTTVGLLSSESSNHVTTSGSVLNETTTLPILNATGSTSISTEFNSNATTTVGVSESSNATLVASTSASIESTTVLINGTESGPISSSIANATTSAGLLSSESTNGNVSVTTSASDLIESASGNVSTELASSNLVTIPSVKGNGTGQQVSSTAFDCSSKAVGIYGNPKLACDTKFFICVSTTALAYEQPCPARLYFDSEMKICESWIHILACSGKARPSTQKPSNETLSTVAPVIDCKNKTNGAVFSDPIGTLKPFCSPRFYVCVGGVSISLACPGNLFYDNETSTCERRNRVFACPGKHENKTDASITNPPIVTLPHVNFNCEGHRDGYYVNKCSNEFFSCNGNQARRLNCPAGLVFDPDTKTCEIASNTFICTGTMKARTTPRSTTMASNISAAPTTPSPMDCSKSVDGIYRDPLAKCSRQFYFCAHNVSFHGICPANLYYDSGNKKCDIWLNVFDCSGLHPTIAPSTIRTPVPVFPTVDFDCTRIEDGNYVNPKDKCSKFFYMCANMEAFQQYCPSGLFYDSSRDTCDSWQHVFACSGKTAPPTTPFSANISSKGTTKKPAFDCTGRVDGTYENSVNACSHIYFQCVNEHTYEMACQGNLLFDIVWDRCDRAENVPACSGVSHAPSTSSSSSVSPPSTRKSAFDCSNRADKDYSASKNSCSQSYFTCAGGYTFIRSCPFGTYFDSERDLCDNFEYVSACSGKPRTSTVAGPSTVLTPRPTYSFNCTKEYDGNYQAGNCAQEFWSCVGGLTFPRHCLFGLVYDTEMNDCEFPFLVPKCGGHRFKPSGKPSLPTPQPLPDSFNCTKLIDGNYPDPESKDDCGSKFITCTNGLGFVLRCPNGLFYDSVMDACNRRENVPACTGKSNIPLETSSITGINASVSHLEISINAGESTTINPNHETPLISNKTTLAPNGSTEISTLSRIFSTVSSIFRPIENETTIGTGLLTSKIVANASLETTTPLFGETTSNASFETTTPLFAETTSSGLFNATELLTTIGLINSTSSEASNATFGQTTSALNNGSVSTKGLNVSETTMGLTTAMLSANLSTVRSFTSSESSMSTTAANNESSTTIGSLNATLSSTVLINGTTLTSITSSDLSNVTAGVTTTESISNATFVGNNTTPSILISTEFGNATTTASVLNGSQSTFESGNATTTAVLNKTQSAGISTEFGSNATTVLHVTNATTSASVSENSNATVTGSATVATTTTVSSMNASVESTTGLINGTESVSVSTLITNATTSAGLLSSESTIGNVSVTTSASSLIESTSVSVSTELGNATTSASILNGTASTRVSTELGNATIAATTLASMLNASIETTTGSLNSSSVAATSVSLLSSESTNANISTSTPSLIESTSGSVSTELSNATSTRSNLNGTTSNVPISNGTELTTELGNATIAATTLASTLNASIETTTGSLNSSSVAATSASLLSSESTSVNVSASTSASNLIESTSGSISTELSNATSTGSTSAAISTESANVSTTASNLNASASTESSGVPISSETQSTIESGNATTTVAQSTGNSTGRVSRASGRTRRVSSITNETQSTGFTLPSHNQMILNTTLSTGNSTESISSGTVTSSTPPTSTVI